MKYETNLRNKNRGYLKLIVWQNAMDLSDNLAVACHPERSEGPHTNFVPHPNPPCVINQRRRGPSPSARLGMTQGAPHHVCHA
jgi:hypothetical protein